MHALLLSGHTLCMYFRAGSSLSPLLRLCHLPHLVHPHPNPIPHILDAVLLVRGVAVQTVERISAS